MSKFLKVFVLLLLLIITGLFAYNKLIAKNGIKDWVGEYKSINPNIVKRKFLFTTYDIKGAYFSAAGSRTILLKPDFTFKTTQIAANNDTLYYKGKWKLIDGKPLLRFENKEYYLSQLPLSDRIYYYEKVKTCGGDTINHFAVFKNIN